MLTKFWSGFEAKRLKICLMGKKNKTREKQKHILSIYLSSLEVEGTKLTILFGDQEGEQRRVDDPYIEETKPNRDLFHKALLIKFVKELDPISSTTSNITHNSEQIRVIIVRK